MRALLSCGPLVLGIVPGVLALASATSAQDLSATDYAIEPVTENVYHLTAGRYHSAFVVTEEGIAVTDPIDTEAARRDRHARGRRALPRYLEALYVRVGMRAGKPLETLRDVSYMNMRPEVPSGAE